MYLFFYSLFDLLFRRADIEFPNEGGPIHLNNYDAILTDLSWGNGKTVVGTIFKDKKGRFMDGRRVQTSTVQEIYIVTENSIYKVEDRSWGSEPRHPWGVDREAGIDRTANIVHPTIQAPREGNGDLSHLFDTAGLLADEANGFFPDWDHLPGNLGGQP